MSKYKLLNDSITGEVGSILVRIEDNTFIPFQPANRHYQEYLEWLAEGNEPLLADD